MDDAARLRHLCDQLGAELEDIAPVLGQYYRSLSESGVPDPVAAEMLRDLQARMLGQVPDEVWTPVEGESGD